MNLVLGSSSPLRKAQLAKLQIDFETCSHAIDETRKADESPADLVQRLSEAKAKEVAKQYPHHLVIGSDQVAVFGEDILGKPGNHQNAIKQLTSFSGQSVQFFTGLCLINSDTGNLQYHQDTTRVNFRDLSAAQINNYLLKDKPYQCAGSFRSEDLGCALFKSVESKDPNALIGLPIIKLIGMLANEGIDILG
ncbi:MAG: septum formation inhibitor Maf [Gammaproteobacteria bacterium]|nr:MAG: septum formation inhibitor Maf [Gammaproteobacteria bacterium]